MSPPYWFAVCTLTVPCEHNLLQCIFYFVLQQFWIQVSQTLQCVRRHVSLRRSGYSPTTPALMTFYNTETYHTNAKEAATLEPSYPRPQLVERHMATVRKKPCLFIFYWKRKCQKLLVVALDLCCKEMCMKVQDFSLLLGATAFRELSRSSSVGELVDREGPPTNSNADKRTFLCPGSGGHGFEPAVN
jgi:hypothetical protein